MEAFLAKDTHLDDVGLDSVYIFLEIAASSRNAEIRAKASTIARRYAKRLAKRLMNTDGLLEGGDLVDLLDLLSEAAPLGLDAKVLGRRARESLAVCNSFEDLHGVAFEDLATASEDDLFDAMMSVYSLAKAQAACGDAFKVTPGLAEVLAFLEHRHFMDAVDDLSDEKETFQDHAYLATHVAYILSNYGRLRLWRADAPWVYRYLRANFHAVLADKDIELTAEFVDIFRSLGCREADDADLRAGTAFLLAAQNADGSWGPWKNEEDAYDAMHYTWCALGALRERVFLKGTPYEQHLRNVLDRVNR